MAEARGPPKVDLNQTGWRAGHVAFFFLATLFWWFQRKTKLHIHQFGGSPTKRHPCGRLQSYCFASSEGLERGSELSPASRLAGGEGERTGLRTDGMCH